MRLTEGLALDGHRDGVAKPHVIKILVVGELYTAACGIQRVAEIEDTVEQRCACLAPYRHIYRGKGRVLMFPQRAVRILCCVKQ